MSPFFPNRQLPPCPARTVSCDADSFNKSAVRRPRRAATSCCPPSLVGMSTIAQRSPQRRATPRFARHLRLIPEGDVYFSSRRISGIVSQRESNAQHAPHSRPEQSLQDCAMSPPQLRVATCRGKPGGSGRQVLQICPAPPRTAATVDHDTNCQIYAMPPPSRRRASWLK
jgi:hypothetical protein